MFEVLLWAAGAVLVFAQANSSANRGLLETHLALEGTQAAFDANLLAYRANGCTTDDAAKSPCGLLRQDLAVAQAAFQRAFDAYAAATSGKTTALPPGNAEGAGGAEGVDFQAGSKGASSSGSDDLPTWVYVVITVAVGLLFMLVALALLIMRSDTSNKVNEAAAYEARASHKKVRAHAGRYRP